MTMLIIIAITIPLIIAFLWGLYYYIKKSGREQERLNNSEKVMKSVAKDKAGVIKRLSDSLVTIRNRLRKNATDR